MDNREKRRVIFKGLRNSFFYSLGVALLLFILTLVYSIIKKSVIIKNTYTVYYYFGAFVLLFSIPLLYKRNEDPKLRRVRSQGFLFGLGNVFRNPYAEKAMLESFEEFRGEGFWPGIFVLFFSIMMFAYAIILENIYFNIIK